MQEKVLKQQKNKNTETLKMLLEHKDRIFCICLGFIRNPYDAEDLTHDVYMKALKKLDDLKEPDSAREWLLRITRNTCLDYVRKERKWRLFRKESDMRSIEQEQNSPEFQVLQNEQVQKIKESIKRLPVKLREALVLREYGDLSYEEMSLLLGIKKGTVMSRLNRARQALIEMVRESRHET